MLDDEMFLRAAYRAYFKREPDEDGLNYYLPALQRKSMNKLDVLRSFTQSNEYRQVHNLPIHPLNALHQARMMLIQHCLPEAEVIVDLGGASTDYTEGALLGSGYPHKPREIIIVDLPPEERMLPSAESFQEYITSEGIKITYLYRSMVDLSPIEDESVDMVFSGESIEHVTEEEGDSVCREAYRVLKQGGYFCLDTPNATLTRLESPHQLIHPEHKIEYHVQELKDKLNRWGFEMLEEKAVCPMPESIASGDFSYDEMVQHIGLSDNAEEGYLFFLKAVKP
ncbi:MAG: methyltransferase domain-containing protein [Chloroflexota bacterium]|nr:methyltransferase domain-containing protein [Chloroflexota bacterium]